MKNKNIIIVVVLLIVVVVIGAVFFFGRNKSANNGVTGVSTEIYNNGMRVFDSIRSGDISVPDISELTNEDWSNALSGGLMYYRSSLYDISAETDEEIDFLATIYYALCSKYYEKVMDVVIAAIADGYIENLDIYEAQELKDKFISDYGNAIVAIDSKDIEVMRTAIYGIDVERAIDEFSDYHIANFGDITSDTGNFGFNTDLFGLDDNYGSSGGLSSGSEFSLQ